MIRLFELECDLLRRNRYLLREKARAYESQKSYYEVALADMGITRTPSEVLDTDLIYYLVREFTDRGINDFYSELDGIPHILEIDYLRYKYKFLEQSDLKDVLRIIIKYLECCKYLKGIYEYEREIHIIPRLANTLSKVTLRYKDKPDSDGWFSTRNLKSIDSIYNSLHGEADKVISVSGQYYKYFTRVTGYTSKSLNWTFFEGLTRSQELSFLKYVVKGKIRPTGIPKEYYDKYLEHLVEGASPYEELRSYLLEDLQIAINKVKAAKGYVKAITPYGVYYYDQEKEFKYKTVVTFYCFDYEREEMLPLNNQLNGLGGEFSTDIRNSLDGVPYRIKGYSGIRKMYKVANKTKVRYYDLEFKGSRGALRAMFENRKVTGMVEVTEDNKRALRRELDKTFK